MLELANASEAAAILPPFADPSEEIARLRARIGELEARQTEQDKAMRRTLTMLIEWVEASDAPRAAA